VLYHALFGGITPEIPASILQLHQDVTVIVEESAAHLVKHKYQNHRI
jgi:glucosamine-6-phosphate deaminase